MSFFQSQSEDKAPQRDDEEIADRDWELELEMLQSQLRAERRALAESHQEIERLQTAREDLEQSREHFEQVSRELEEKRRELLEVQNREAEREGGAPDLERDEQLQDARRELEELRVLLGKEREEKAELERRIVDLRDAPIKKVELEDTRGDASSANAVLFDTLKLLEGTADLRGWRWHECICCRGISF